MARPLNITLSYAPIDTDIFDDPKLLFVSDRFDEKGELVTLKLLLFIYRQGGYKIEWNDEMAMIFTKRNFTTIKFGLVDDVVKELLKRGFFDEFLFKSFGILTSHGIQKRWQEIADRKKWKHKIPDGINLLIPKIKEETPPIREETTPKQESIVSESEESATNKSKEKEKKLKEIKRKKLHDDFSKKLIEETSYWKDTFMIQNQIKNSDLPQVLDNFKAHLMLEEKTHEEFEEFKKHLKNWTKYPDSISSNNFNNQASKSQPPVYKKHSTYDE